MSDRWCDDRGTRAELVSRARTVLMASGMTNAAIDEVLLDGEPNPNTDVDLTAARAVGGLLRSALEQRDVR